MLVSTFTNMFVNMLVNMFVNMFIIILVRAHRIATLMLQRKSRTVLQLSLIHI